MCTTDNAPSGIGEKDKFGRPYRWVIVDSSTGEPLEHHHYQVRAEVACEWANDHEELNGRPRVFVLKDKSA